MIDPGDSVTLTAQFYAFDGSGNKVLTDPGATPVLAVTRPDGTPATISSPATRISPGTYQAALVDTAQLGLYPVLWTSSVGLTAVYDDSFTVTKSQMLISLDDAMIAVGKAQFTQQVNLSTNDAADLQEALRAIVNGARGPMEELVGPILPEAFDEWHDGGSATVMTWKYPLLAVTLIGESYGSSYFRTLTAQPLDGGTFDAFGYTVDLKTGEITRRLSGGATDFAYGRNNIHVVGTYGRATMPAHLTEMVKRYVKWAWQTAYQGQKPQGSQPERIVSVGAYQVPQACITYAGGDLRVPGLL